MLDCGRNWRNRSELLGVLMRWSLQLLPYQLWSNTTRGSKIFVTKAEGHDCEGAGRGSGKRHGLRARRGDHREGTQRARPDVLDRRGHGGERHLHLSAEQVTQCKGDAAIRH